MAGLYSPAVVIATRKRLIEDLGKVLGDRSSAPQREAAADWMLESGFLADSYYAAVAADLEKSEVIPDAAGQ